MASRIPKLLLKAEQLKLFGRGPFIGPKGGKWADARHTIPWKERKGREGAEDEKKERGKVIYFASGSNHPGEIAGFARIDHPVGVAIPNLDKQGAAVAAMKRLSGTGLPVFVDSGAFSEVDRDDVFKVVAPINHDEWLRRLALYQDLANSLKGQLVAVAPDRVANAEVTLERMTRYREQVQSIAKTGAKVLVPLQGMDKVEFWPQAQKALGMTETDNLIPSMPMRKDATSPQEVKDFVRTVKPKAIHLLGLGPSSDKYEPLVRDLRKIAPGMTIYSDSVAIRAAAGYYDTASKRDYTRPKPLTASQLKEEQNLQEHLWEAPPSDAVPSISGDMADYTEEIVTPSTWIKKSWKNAIGKQMWGNEIARLEKLLPVIEEKLGQKALSRAESEIRDLKNYRNAWNRDPDAFLQSDAPNGRPWYEDPELEVLLDHYWAKSQAEARVATKKARAVVEVFGKRPKLIIKSLLLKARKPIAGQMGLLGMDAPTKPAKTTPSEPPLEPAPSAHETPEHQREAAEHRAKAKHHTKEATKPITPKGGPFIGPRGGKWADAAHTKPWTEDKPEVPVGRRLSQAFDRLMNSGKIVNGHTLADESGMDYPTAMTWLARETKKGKLVKVGEGRWVPKGHKLIEVAKRDKPEPAAPAKPKSIYQDDPTDPRGGKYRDTGHEDTSYFVHNEKAFEGKPPTEDERRKMYIARELETIEDEASIALAEGSGQRYSLDRLPDQLRQKVQKLMDAHKQLGIDSEKEKQRWRSIAHAYSSHNPDADKSEHWKGEAAWLGGQDENAEYESLKKLVERKAATQAEVSRFLALKAKREKVEKEKERRRLLDARNFQRNMENAGWQFASTGPGYQTYESTDRKLTIRIESDGGQWKMSGEAKGPLNSSPTTPLPGGTYSSIKEAQDAALAVMKAPRPEAKPERSDVAGLPFPVSPGDLSGQLATQAYSGSSFTPEKRAEQEQQSYVNQMRHVWETYGPKAKTEEEKAALLSDLKDYQRGYLTRLRAKLEAQSRTISPMIAGPSNFPTRRNQKRLDTEHKRLNELIDWNAKALNRIDRNIRARKVEAAGGEAAVMRQKIAAMEKRQQHMKDANKIVRKKKLTDDQKVEQLKGLGLPESVALQLLEPDFAGRKGYADYQLTNNNANIKRSKERLKELEAKEAAKEAAAETGGVGATKEGKGWRMEEHVEDDRIRLFFDEKPSAEQRKALKGSGWRWSPRAGAWQRKITLNARRSAEDILERHFEKAIPRLVLRLGA